MSLENYVKAGALILRAAELSDKAKAASAAARKLLNRTDACFSYGQGEKCLFLEIPLADYLAIYPGTKPEAKSYTNDSGTTKVWMRWQDRLAGETKDGTSVWIHAETDCVDMPKPKPQTEESAA